MRIAPWSPREESIEWGPWRPDLELEVVLTAARHRGHDLVMLTGEPIPREWFLSAPDSWNTVRVFLDHETPAGRYRHAESGHEVEVRRAAEWFGSGDYTWTTAREAWAATRSILRSSGRGGAVMFRSPGATGLDLWLRTTSGEVPDPLDEDTQKLIRSTSPQHRIEMFPPRSQMIPALWVLDGRWMYASLLRELGSGPARMLTGAAASELADRHPHARARYLVKFEASGEWAGTGWPGLLMAQEPDSLRWHAPLSGTSWVDAAELHLARRMGWTVEVVEGIEFSRGRPLDAWGERLVRARDSATDLDLGPDVGPLVRSAIRSALLYAIGSWHSAGRDETTVTASTMQRPRGDGWDAPERLDNGRVVWRRAAPRPSPRALAMRHPEWSSQVWGRAHARILDSPTGTRGQGAGALHVDPETLVSIYGDAIMTTRRPRWADLDDGRPGRLRVKGHLCGPIPWPTSAAERDELSRAAVSTTCEKGCE